jgi:hypothetical protein
LEFGSVSVSSLFFKSAGAFTALSAGTMISV